VAGDGDGAGDPCDVLAPSFDDVIVGGGLVASGIGLAGRGPPPAAVSVSKDLVVDGVPPGALVVTARIYWMTIGGPDDTVTVNGTNSFVVKAGTTYVFDNLANTLTVNGRARGTVTAIVNAFDTALRRDHVGDLIALSSEERDCLSWLAAGLRRKQIADRLRLTDRQLETRLNEARDKLKAVTVTQAVASALILGLIEP